MALVSFERIVKLLPQQVSSRDTTIAQKGIGPLDGIDGAAGAGARTNVYDPLWGYFKFGQEIAYEYDEAKTYVSYGRFTITGVFTRNAEMSNREDGNYEDFKWPTPSTEDTLAFTKLTDKYEALATVFREAGLAEEPADYGQWGGASDPRCIVLPLPLVDKNGDRIYALPEDISVEPGQWPWEIRYTATLREARFPGGKLMVNGFLVDNAQVTITYPSPLISKHSLVATCGELIQVKNYGVTEIDIGGDIPIAPGSGESVWNAPSGINTAGHALRLKARQVLVALQADNSDVQISVLTPSGLVTRDLWMNWQRQDPTPFEVDLERRVAVIGLKIKE